MKKILIFAVLTCLFGFFPTYRAYAAGGTCQALVNTSTLNCYMAVNNCTAGYTAKMSGGGTVGCSCTCESTNTTFSGTATTGVCNYVSTDKQTDCWDNCMSDGAHVWTAIGCLSTTGGGFVKNLLTIGTGAGGGIALLLILFGALQIMTSAGNPEKLNAGKELVTASITGLLFIIFSIFILRIIGVDILSIPTFS